jgi:nucleotide-binding universal stress UspA family protein
MSEPSANAVRAAESTDLVGNGRITLIHAFGALGKMSVAGLEHASVDEFVASERKRAMSELVAFLDASNLADHRWSLRVEEGAAFKVISDVVEEMRPDLLIVGTHGRSGIIKVLLGSVTEEALRSLDVDILAVPPVR